MADTVGASTGLDRIGAVFAAARDDDRAALMPYMMGCYPDREGALAASKNAKIWTWVSFGLGMLIVAFYALLAVAGLMGELK